MISISPYQLWKFVPYGPDKPLIDATGQRKYADYRLSQMLLVHQIKLMRVTIINSIETFNILNNIPYLRAHVFMVDINCEEMVMDLKPRFLGDDGEWALMSEDLTVDDLDIRFILDNNRLEPTWISAHKDGKKLPLGGDVFEWELAHRLDEEKDRNKFYDSCEYFSPDELEAMKTESFDPDYCPSDSDRATYYWWM